MLKRTIEVYEIDVTCWNGSRCRSRVFTINENCLFEVVRTLQVMSRYYNMGVFSVVDVFKNLQDYSYFEIESYNKNFEIVVNISKIKKLMYV